MAIQRGTWTEDFTLKFVAVRAAERVAQGEGDDLVVLPLQCPPIPGEQTDDEIRAIAAIDVVRHLMNLYELERDQYDHDHNADFTCTNPLCATCPKGA